LKRGFENDEGKWIVTMIKMTRKTIIITAAIIIPVLVSVLMEFNIVWEVETDNDWIGFFASYIGSLIGVFGVFEVMRLDQRKREEEKKDDIFFSNISIYRKIATALQVDKLHKLNGQLSELRSESNWNMVDNATKNSLKHIESSLYYSNEIQGLFNAIREFIQGNLYDELKIARLYSMDEYGEPIEHEDVPDEILFAFTNCVLKNSDIKLDYDVISMSLSKDKLLEKFDEDDYTKGYGSKIDAIYDKLLRINESKEWSHYVSERRATFEEIKNLKNKINNRIEKALNY
jgi:hypothetical protein